MTSEGLLFSALCGTNAAIRKDCRVNCIRGAALPYAVGYAQSGLTGGTYNTLATFQFKDVGNGETVNINSVKCPDDAMDMVQLRTLSPDGTVLDTFYWSEGDNGAEWEDADFNPIPDQVFAPGIAFWIQCDLDDGSILQSSGQVNSSDVTTELNGGTYNTAVGNATPVSVNIQDILCPDDCIDMIQLRLLKSDGTIDTTYYWSEDAEAEWEDADFNRADVDFAPGQSFWIQCDAEDGVGTITFPGVELK